jgi:hypothetical protein
VSITLDPDDTFESRPVSLWFAALWTAVQNALIVNGGNIDGLGYSVRESDSKSAAATRFDNCLNLIASHAASSESSGCRFATASTEIQRVGRGMAIAAANGGSVPPLAR